MCLVVRLQEERLYSPVQGGKGVDDDNTARVTAVRQKESETQPNPVCQLGRVVVRIRTVAKLIHTGGKGDQSLQNICFSC